MFDRVLTVDWSGRSKPSPVAPCADAIFTCYGDQTTLSHPIYHRTRQSAMDYIHKVVEASNDQKGTTLIGFDFSFGYPRGFAEHLTGSRDIRSLWRCLADRIQDDAQNANNRFQVAADINGMFQGVGPFWGAPANVQYAELPYKGSQRHGHGLPEIRAAEDGVKGAQSSWKLFTTGSVGSQALLGIARLHQLVSRFPDIHLWPFDGPIPPGIKRGGFGGNLSIHICLGSGRFDPTVSRSDLSHQGRGTGPYVDRGFFKGAPRGLGCRLSK